jgi:glycosyltransferase involved in cell wall biosynthesis
MAQMSQRIAVVAPSAPPFSAGGVASAHYNLFHAMKAKGLNVKLFTFFDNGIPTMPDEDIVRHGFNSKVVAFIYWLARLPFRVLQPGKSAFQTAVILRSLLGAQKMARSINKFDPDIIVLSDHGAPGLSLRKKAHQHFFLISHHNPARFADEPLLGDYSKLDARWAVRLENLALRQVDQVLCPSAYMAEWFRETYHFRRPVSVVPNLIDNDLIDRIPAVNLRAELGLSDQAKLIYLPSVGALVKGAQFLPEILEGLAATKKELGLYIPGHVEGDAIALLKKFQAKIPVYMPGQIEYEHHIGIVKSCDFGISPALMENFSMAILEAVYCGVPMLVFDRGGNRDIIHDGKNGYLAPGLEITKLVDLARQLMSMESLSEFKAKTTEFTHHQFASSTVLRKYLRVMGVDGFNNER